MTYRLRVRNTSSVSVESIVLRDVLPSGMALVVRPTGSTIKSGAIVWQLGTLAPGEHRMVTLKVRLDPAINGRRCNTASLSAANASTVTARACSAIRAVGAAIRVPIVTG